MKAAILILLFNLIVCSGVFGQTGNTSAISRFYFVNTSSSNPKFHFCQESKVGFGITAAGILLGCAGIIEYNTANHNDNDYRHNKQANTGAAMWLVGGVVAIMGSVFAIDGSVHDMHRFYHEHKFSITSGSRNEIGLAYNF